jgi:glyoxylase-like metal-dependent hydrolase (beta-lactamase superfamily II)
MPDTTEVISIELRLSNVFLVCGERWILVDAGAPGDAPAILRAAERRGVRPADIGLILLTHGHVDHVGAASALRAATGAPIAAHAGDLPLLRAGRNPDTLAAVGVEGRLFRPMLPWSADPVEPDIVFDGDLDLAGYGLDARTIHTPGHSSGHVALPLPGGGVVAGDLLRGGFLGGRLRGGLACLPYYAEDTAALQASIALLLGLPSHTLYVGHGGPIASDHARARLASGALTLRDVRAAAHR